MFGCGCIALILAVLTPRFLLVLMWIFTDSISRAFNGFLLPLLGIIFLPFTTLIYVLVYNPIVGLSGWDWALIIIAFVIDLGSYGGKAYTNRQHL